MVMAKRTPSKPSPVAGGAPLPKAGVGVGLGNPLDPNVSISQAVAAAKAERQWAGWARPLPAAEARS